MKRRILAALLALCLFAGLFPAGSAAEAGLEMSVDLEQLTAHARTMYMTLEGYYWSVTRDDCGAVSIGFMQWHGENALKLMKKICAADPALSKSTLGDALYHEIVKTPVYTASGTVGWQDRILSVEEGQKVSALINTETGRRCQDETADEFIRSEAQRGWNRGVRTEAALLYYCSIENQYGSGGAWDVLSDARAAVGLGAEELFSSLNQLHNAVIQASVSWKYIRDHLTYRKNVYKLLTETLKLDPGAEIVLPRLTELPADGATVVLYSESGKGVLGSMGSSGPEPAALAAAALGADGTLRYEDLAEGALIFRVRVTGSGDSASYRFACGGKYLALPANGTDAQGKTVNSGRLELVSPEEAAGTAYTQWTPVAVSGGWVLVNRAACQGSAQCCVELHKSGFRGGRYTVSAPARYALNFFPVKDRSGSGCVRRSQGDAALGVDLSWFNGEIDWSLLAPSVDFALLRAGYTGNGEAFALAKDSTYEFNAAGCAAQGLPFGVYYYGCAVNPEQAKLEAEALLDWLGTEHLPSLPVFYDVLDGKLLKLDDATLLEVVRTFCETVEAAGFRAGVHATEAVWSSRLTDPAYGAWVCWTAQWDSGELHPAGEAALWQFTDKARLPGVKTQVHLDCWLGSLGEEARPAEAYLCPADCGEDGLLSLRCPAQENQQRWLRLPALGHLWSDESGTEPPSCTQQGWSYHACLRCEARQRFDPVPALGHSWSKQTETVAPSCTLGGYTLRSCTRCGQTERIKETAALGHKWDKGTLIRQPSESREGLRQYRCTRCGGVKEESLACFRFADVKDASKPYYDAVYWAYWHSPEQITAGVSKTRFGPEQTVTRAQAMVFLWAAKNKPAPRSGSSPFADVKKGDWYYKAVLWAVENRITAGTDASHFSPGKTCSRAEILTFLYAAMGKPRVQLSSPYRDVGSQWYQKAALWAYAKRIEKGEQGRFHPATPCTRAAIVSYLYRTLERKGLLK